MHKMNERLALHGVSAEIQAPLKEPISDNEMGSLISAIGNSEAKAILLGLMHDEVVYSAYDLSNLMNRSQGAIIGWKMSVANPYQYCRQSLEPIGLVAQEVTIKRQSIGYAKTTKGSTLGISLAGLLLDFSLSHPEYGLQDFFGSSQSTGKEQTEGELEFRNRTPEFRRRLFRYLATAQSPVTVADVGRETGYTGRGTDEHFSKLSEKGVLNYQSIKKGKTNIEYTFSEQAPDGDPKPIGGWNSAMRLALANIKDNPEKSWSPEELAKLYLESRGREIAPAIIHTKKMFEKILNHLAKAGFIKKTLEFADGAQSWVDLTERQRESLYDLSERLIRFQNQETEVLEFGRKRLGEILSEPALISILLAKAKEHSNYVNFVPTSESSSVILGIITDSPGITIKELRLALGSRGLQLNTVNIRGLVSQLIEGRSVVKQHVRGEGHLYISTAAPN